MSTPAIITVVMDEQQEGTQTVQCQFRCDSSSVERLKVLMGPLIKLWIEQKQPLEYFNNTGKQEYQKSIITAFLDKSKVPSAKAIRYLIAGDDGEVAQACFLLTEEDDTYYADLQGDEVGDCIVELVFYFRNNFPPDHIHHDLVRSQVESYRLRGEAHWQKMWADVWKSSK